MGKPAFDTGLGRAGIVGRGVAPVILADIGRGWQSAAYATANQDALSTLQGPGGTVEGIVELPPEGRTIMLRAISATVGTVVAQIVLFPPAPPDSASGDDADDNAAASSAGWIEKSQTFTTAASGGESDVIAGTGTDLPLSDYILIDRKGAKWMAVRITTVANNGEESEIQYRVF